MAKVSIEFDTNEKTLGVSVDGKMIDNVIEAYVRKSYYSDEKEYGCSITTLSEDKENDTRTMTRLVASESTEGKEVVTRDGVSVTPVEGFVVASNLAKVADDIAKYFTKS